MPRISLKQATDIVALAGTIFSVYYIYKALESETGRIVDESATTSKEVCDPQSGLEVEIDVNEYEAQLLQHLIKPDQISTGFKDIGGLDAIANELHETVIFPLKSGHKLKSSLFTAPKGVLLYGPPGCGKTMLAKALAKECNANFLNIQLSTLMNKWYGESNKIVTALFSLARKISPTIIFIDEIDSFLRSRSSQDHEMSAQMKAEFMVCWDGLLGDKNGVMVLGATNRIFDIDSAVLRRMPKRFEILKPGPNERRKILELVLADTSLSSDLDWHALVLATENMSGSDISEFCRNAAMQAARELYKAVSMVSEAEADGIEMRPLVTADFLRDLD